MGQFNSFWFYIFFVLPVDFFTIFRFSIKGGKFGLSGNSLLLLYQLEDKRKTLSLLWEFLKRMNIWKQVRKTFSSHFTFRKVSFFSLLFVKRTMVDESLVKFYFANTPKSWIHVSPLLKRVGKSTIGDRFRSIWFHSRCRKFLFSGYLP